MRSIIAFVLFFCFATPLYAQEATSEGTGMSEETAPAVDPAQVQQVIDLMRGESTQGYLNRDVREAGGEIAFRYEGLRYTLSLFGGGEGPPFLTVSVRADGASDDSVETCSDDGLDGEVDSGVAGVSEPPGEESRMLERASGEGIENWSYWQALYARALTAAIATLH